MPMLRLNVTAQSKPMPEQAYNEIMDLSFDNGGNGIEVIPRHLEEFPMPWDADCYIEDGHFVLDGHASAGGVGRAITKVPLAKVNNLLYIQIHMEDDSHDFDAKDVNNRLKELFTEYNWL